MLKKLWHYVQAIVRMPFRLKRIEAMLLVAHYDLEKCMRTLDEVLAKVTEQTTALDSVKSLIVGLKQQLEEALSGVLTPDQQAKVDAIFAAAETNSDKITEALNANV